MQLANQHDFLIRTIILLHKTQQFIVVVISDCFSTQLFCDATDNIRSQKLSFLHRRKTLMLTQFTH